MLTYCFCCSRADVVLADFSGGEPLFVLMWFCRVEKTPAAAVESRRHGQSAFLPNHNERSILINGSTLAAIV